MPINQLSSRFTSLNGNQLVNCSTTAYLGLNHHPKAKQYYQEGIQQFGLSYGSSPLTEPKLAIYAEFEEKIASIYQTEDAVLFPTGFAASQSVVQCLNDELVEIHYGNYRHPSLQVDNSIVATKRAFVTDFVDTLHCAKIKENDIPDEMDYVVLDASHAFGLYDSELAGYGRNTNFIICGSLNKGLSTQAGVVLCNREFATILRRHPMYSTSSPPAPSACHTLLWNWSGGVVVQQQQKLNQLLQLVDPRPELFHFLPSLPVLSFLENDESIYHSFFDHGFLIWHNEYPKYSGNELNRIVIHAGLEAEDIHEINDLMKNI